MEFDHKTITEFAEELKQVPFFEEYTPVNLLKKIPFFDGVEEKLLKETSEMATLLSFKPGEVVFKQGDYGDTFYIMLGGSVEVSVKTRQNPRLVLATLPAGAFFGELGPLTDDFRSATITTAENTTLLELPRNLFLTLFKKSPQIKERIDAVYRERTLSTHLRRVGIFSELPDDVIEVLMDKVKLVNFNKDDEIIKEGDDGSSLFIVRSGFVKISVMKDGEDTTLAYLKDGNYFGEMAVIKGEKRTATVTAMTRVSAVALMGEDFKELLEQFPGIREKIEATIKAREKEAKELADDQNKKKLLKITGEHGLVQSDNMLAMDMTLCIRCNLCIRACAYTHDRYPRLERWGIKFGRAVIPTSCTHCNTPDCLLCVHGGISRDPKGEVYFTDFCINCGACVKRCPYGNILYSAPYPEYTTTKIIEKVKKILLKDIKIKEDKKKRAKPPKKFHKREGDVRVVKCDMCLGRAFIACIYHCPTNAMKLVDPEDLLELAR